MFLAQLAALGALLIACRKLLHLEAFNNNFVCSSARVRLCSSRSLQCSAASKPWSQRDGRLVLADGTVLSGRCFGAPGVKVAEIVFNTSMSGYQEIMTDPSYRDQMVCFTHPHIGNVGINDGAERLIMVAQCLLAAFCIRDARVAESTGGWGCM